MSTYQMAFDHKEGIVYTDDPGVNDHTGLPEADRASAVYSALREYVDGVVPFEVIAINGQWLLIRKVQVIHVDEEGNPTPVIAPKPLTP